MNVQDLHDLIRLLEQHPEWRAELRRLVLTDELLELPELVRQLIEAQQRIEAQIAELVATQQMLVETQKQHSQEIRELREIAQQNTEAIRELREVSRQNTEAIRELQATVQQHSQEIRELRAIAQQNTEAIRELREATQRNTEAINRLSAIQEQQTAELRHLQRTVAELSEDVRGLLEWQRGEAGRREGEQYEQRILKRAVNLFYGGDGGATGETHVRRRIARWLRPLYQSDNLPDSPADPAEADLIWWKGDTVMVVEVSLKVNGQDVRRARRRADTLRQVGVNAVPVVIGEEWATPDARTTAQQEQVEWKIGSELSAGFIALRQIPDETPENAEPASEYR